VRSGCVLIADEVDIGALAQADAAAEGSGGAPA
jgi:hypothetical protein